MRIGLAFALLLLAHPASAAVQDIRGEAIPDRLSVIEVVSLSNGIDPGKRDRFARPPVALAGDPDSPMDMIRPLALFSSGLGRLRLDLPRRARVFVDVFAVNGRRVGGRDLGVLDAGSHQLMDLGLGRAPAGVYFAQIRAGGQLARAKVIWLR